MCGDQWRRGHGCAWINEDAGNGCAHRRWISLQDRQQRIDTQHPWVVGWWPAGKVKGVKMLETESGIVMTGAGVRM